ncbi:hypothetical protein O3M35_001024 [Rhynocoris fuscipes]|uniref:Uncharacterized protein n=1 Tax=Rhynocoris fuscipes TaxID=488301 RepID=A0AAW1DPT5_9HEMI
MSVTSKKVKTNISRVRDVLSSLDNNSVKVIRYNIPKSHRVTFKRDNLNNEPQFVLPQHVPEDILTQNEIDQSNKSNYLLRRNKKPIKRIKKLSRSKIQESDDRNLRSQELQEVRAEIDKMENKLMPKRKDFNKNISRTQKITTIKPKVKFDKIDTITQTEANDYDPNDYMDAGDIDLPTGYTYERNNEELFIQELKKKAIINDKLPFELGTKISPNDKDAVSKLRLQLSRWRHSNAIDVSSPIEMENETVDRLGAVIREEPERDGSPIR